MNQEEAIEAKEAGTLPEDYKVEVLTPLKMLLLQIKHTSNSFIQSQHGFVASYPLAGGVARQPGLDDLIQEQFRSNYHYCKSSIKNVF